MVLPVVVVMAALLLSLTRVVVVSMDCQDAAAAAAREAVLAGGEGDPVAVAKEAAGGSATVEISRADGAVTVTVGCPVLPGPLGVLPTRVTGTAVGVGQ
ncbi:TadE family type IV pilus minor pilin [Bifidobacterium pullorum]